MKRSKEGILGIGLMLASLCFGACTEGPITRTSQIDQRVEQYERADFEIEINRTFENPYDQYEIKVDMILESPSGKSITLPCFFDRSHNGTSFFRARFAPGEYGTYTYYFAYTSANDESITATSNFEVSSSLSDGFLHINDQWTFKFDSGRPFRGIGENVGWEARSHEDPKYTYDYLLPSIAKNGANFFRTWMCAWDLPIAWKKVKDTDRYTNSDEYFHPQGIRRMDELIDLCDSLGLYVMLAMDYHGALIPGGGWEDNSYNVKNGGPAADPTDFFVNPEARKMSKNKLRYLVARWGYSTQIGAWEFFNEIDNAVFGRNDSTLIPHDAVTSWHEEMSAYLKAIDPYDHIITTSVSHRDIEGMFQLKDIDLVQRHIYRHTDKIPGLINSFGDEYQKPFIWGEFGYEWDWNKDFSTMVAEKNYDYKRGLWYGLFNPTPVLPMTWWWEFFDEQNMTPYFQGVRLISDLMLEEGSGKFEPLNTQSGSLETMAMSCGDKYLLVALNNDKESRKSDVELEVKAGKYQIERFDPDKQFFVKTEVLTASENNIKIKDIALEGMDEMVYMLSPVM